MGGSAPERLENQHVLEGIGEVVLPADDVADAQVGIVGAGRHVIRRQAIAPQQREVLDIVGGLGLRAINGVVELDDAIRATGHAKTHDERLTGSSSTVAVGGAQFPHAGVEQPSGFRRRVRCLPA